MDCDIDLPPSFDPKTVFPDWTRASILKDGKLTPHPCGVYPQFMAKDPISRLAAIPYNVAEELGFLKLDFLHLNVYSHFQSRKEIEELVAIDPDWNLLLIPSVVEKLFQISKHIDILQKVRPNNIEDLSDVLALIRPGKKELLGLYMKDKLGTRRMLYAKNANGEYAFKKSHAIAYSLVIVLQLHLVSAGLL